MIDPDRCRCDIRLSPSSASLSVRGRNVLEVRGTFLELERELDSRKYEFSWMAHLLRPPGRFPFENLAVTMTLYILYSWLMTFLVRPLISGVGTSTQAVIAVGVFVLSVCCALLTLRQVENAFPSVRFQGRFFDFSRRPRKVLYGIMMSVIVPLALRAFYDLRRH